jgi:pimeloyl-ACP methyl ester carboxylesterase
MKNALTGPVVVALLVGAAGLAATVTGLSLFVADAALAGFRWGDVAGIGVAVAGLVLLGLAFRIAFRGRRRRVQLLAVPIALVLLQWGFVPAINAGLVTHTGRPPIGPASTLGLAGARDVVFSARDGVRLGGWFVPGSNGAGMVVLHGSHGTRADTLRHVRVLSGAGYAVLAFDARGHGGSAGATNALGWHAADDVAAAVAFISRAGGVDARRIGGLGLSMGAEELLRAAATGVPLRAVIADGAGASTRGDRRLMSGDPGPLADSVDWLTMRQAELISHEPEPVPLATVARRIDARVLLIASNRRGEQRIDRVYRERIGRNATLWYVSDAAHTAALTVRPAEYRARVLAFLDAALTRS